jgi:hypothetical protein
MLGSVNSFSVGALAFAFMDDTKKPIMRDIKNPAALWLKALLLLGVGVTASILLALELGTLKGVLLLALSIWAFCRAYYFAFYVIENYVDPGYRFSGLISVVKYLMLKKRR